MMFQGSKRQFTDVTTEDGCSRMIERMRQGGMWMVFNGDSNVYSGGKKSFRKTTGTGEQIDGNRNAAKISHMPLSASNDTLE